MGFVLIVSVKKVKNCNKVDTNIKLVFFIARLETEINNLKYILE